MSDRSASRELRDALAKLPPWIAASASETLGPLHGNVCAAVDEMKLSGMAPEHVILAIKDIASDANLGSLRTQLVEQLVRWCIEHYFAQPHA